MRLADKVAIITGGARGIGRAVALGFAREGASVVIADVRAAMAQETVEEIEAAGGGALAVETDVADPATLDRLVAATVERFGRIDILHNNAGTSGGAGGLFSYTEEDWDRILTVNLKAPFLLSQRVARVMVDQGRGGRMWERPAAVAFTHTLPTRERRYLGYAPRFTCSASGFTIPVGLPSR